jgi:hypothetical protein
MKLVRFAPVYYGFGPAGKCLHVARALRALLGVDTEFELVAPGPVLQMAESELFGHCGEEPSDRRADVVVSFMNRAAAFLAEQRGEPIVFVDSLAWLWDKPLELPSRLALYLYQELPLFPARRSNVKQWGQRALPVGGIVGPRSGGVDPEKAVELAVSISGIENFEVSVSGGNAFYAQLIARELESLMESKAVDVAILGNRVALEAYFKPGFRASVGNGRQDEALNVLRHAASAVISPGLTTVLELVSSRSGFSVLPPQNYSQVQIAKRLRSIGVPGAGWPGDVAPWLEDAVIPEVVGSQIARAIVGEASSMDVFAGQLFKSILAQPPLAITDAWVRENFGPIDGAETVSNAIREFL